jgi:hypothetical protein
VTTRWVTLHPAIVRLGHNWSAINNLNHRRISIIMIMIMIIIIHFCYYFIKIIIINFFWYNETVLQIVGLYFTTAALFSGICFLSFQKMYAN